MAKTTKKKTIKKSSGKAVVTESSSEDKTSVKKAKVFVKAILGGERVITEVSDEAREFYNQSRFGTIGESGKVELSLLEGLYLMEKGRLDIKSENGRKLSHESFIKKARKVDPEQKIRVVDFINYLRAMTFSPFNNAYIEMDGEKYFIEIKISKDQVSINNGEQGFLKQYGFEND